MKHIYSIGGGKGGSGKSFIAASLGILLAKQGNEAFSGTSFSTTNGINALHVPTVPLAGVQRVANISVQMRVYDIVNLSKYQAI